MNFFNRGGPRAADLIHLGAKFAPCMRLDDKITQQIEKTRKKEKETACCIRNDDSGCVQSSQADCSVSSLMIFLISFILFTILRLRFKLVIVYIIKEIKFQNIYSQFFYWLYRTNLL